MKMLRRQSRKIEFPKASSGLSLSARYQIRVATYRQGGIIYG
jgi:hypothetical protein